MTSFHSTLRLTPSHSPFFKSPAPRSPTKIAPRGEEPCLHLEKVIGTTTASANAFDSLSSRSKIAFTAGAAAVVATIGHDLSVTQEFFRANPSTASIARDAANAWPLTPTPNEARFRQGGSVKENVSPVASSGRDWSDSPTGRSSAAKDRIKAATSVALSPNGKWLAVGETGYRPRILIFSARDGSSETPVCILSEHTFGVHSLKFSGDSRYLASLGTVNDGFLYIWTMEERTGLAMLFASNKCTTTIHSMAWMGPSLVTVGLRFVKVWRPDEDTMNESRERDRSGISTPRPKLESRCSDFGNSILSPRHRVLAGKNSLLGDLLEATFISVVPISSTRAVVCAESGEICILDDRDKVQSLTLAMNAGMRITAARADEQDMFHVSGEDEQAASYLIPVLERRGSAGKAAKRPSMSPVKASYPKPTSAVVTATVGDAVVEMDSDRVIKLTKSRADGAANGIHQPRHLPAHQDAVLGVQAVDSPFLSDARFFTFSVNGTVRFWDIHGNSVAEAFSLPIDDSAEMYGQTNELKACAMLVNGCQIASGDRYGSLALVDLESRRTLHTVRAHSAEVTEVIAFERSGAQFVASASRDRTVQLFVCTNGKLELLQTMDEHAGAVTGLLIAQGGSQLLSCSADRSVVVRECIQPDQRDPGQLAFAMVRAMTLKSTPTSMCLTTQRDTILIATMDRCVAKYSTGTGHAGFSFKCTDNDGGEAVVLSSIRFAPCLNGNPTIVGVATDKSVRLYSDYGTLIARDWGHTEGITDVALVTPFARGSGPTEHESPQIVTVAADSTIFLWESRVTPPRSATQLSDHSESTPTSTPLGPPLRKVISHSEISRMRRDRTTDEQNGLSPSSTITPTRPASPPKVRKKTSRLSLAPNAPRLEPAFRSNFDSSRRRSLRQRSPSPPSPRNANKKDHGRGQLGMSLRSKSSENILGSSSSTYTGFGSLTSSTETVCRTLRAYRKKLANASSSSNDHITPDALRELEKELKLTARVVGERSHGKNLDEATIAKLLDQASNKIVGLLDEKIKHRVESEVRKSGELSSPASCQTLEPPVEQDELGKERIERSDTAPGALESRRG